MDRTTLPQTVRNMERMDRVNALLKQADGLGIQTTRRQARKALSGRGGLMAKIREAEANRAAEQQ